MKPRRIFIAINLPEAIKKQLLAYKEKWPELPARWTTKENLHLTLAFLGNTSEKELQKLPNICKEVGERHSSFTLEITHVQYGPHPQKPRMIWAAIKNSQALLNLQQDIVSALGRKQDQQFDPHLTLARLKTFELQGMEQEELPQINEEILLSFEVQSIEIMESKLKRSGAEYTILQACMLKKGV